MDPATTIFPSSWIANPREVEPESILVVALPLPPNDGSREPSTGIARGRTARRRRYPALPAATIFPSVWIARRRESSSRVNLVHDLAAAIERRVERPVRHVARETESSVHSPRNPGFPAATIFPSA